MAAFRNLNLTLDVINDILVLDKKNRIFFSGKDIHRFIFKSAKSHKPLFLDNFPNLEDKQGWLDKISQVRKSCKPQYHHCGQPGIEYTIFPSHREDSSTLIISTKDRIMKTSQMEIDLKERVKEVECLYNISSEIQTHQDLAGALKHSVHHIITGFQFPEITQVEIQVDNHRFGSINDASNSKQQLAEEIVVGGITRGKITVIYRDKEDFLREERKLLKEIAREISKALERQDLNRELKKHLSKLEESVKTKTWQLEESRKRYEDLFNNAPDCIIISNLDGKLTKVNAAFHKILCYPEDKLPELDYVNTGIMEDATKLWPHIIRKLKKQQFLHGVELNLLDFSGNKKSMMGSFRLFDSKNKHHIEAIYKDIKLQKEFEKKLLNHKQKLENLVQQRTKALEKKKKILVLKNKKLMELSVACGESRQKLQVSVQ